jgi:hypothetical protein
MNTNVFSETAAPDAGSSQPRGITAAVVTAFLIAVRSYLKRKAAARSEAASKEELLTAVLAIKDCMHADHLALLEKLAANQRELLAALERHRTDINALACGLARLEERTSKQR